MQLVFVHGWGFHAGVWERTAPRLAHYDPVFLDLGFVRNGPRAVGYFPENAVYVGHSFGVLWLLKHGPRRMRALVSVAGFDCFHAFADAHAIAAMQSGMERNPEAQLKAFWRSCGTGVFADPEATDIATLKAGLDWLARWDERDAHRALDCPVLALASEDDVVVPYQASREMWADADLRTCRTGGHGLPLTEPEWCAEQIESFLRALEP